MALYYCSITGEPAEVPVISKKSGHVFEKRVIEKYIEANQTDPITNQPLTKNDIVILQVNNTVKPRLANATGVSDLMTMFQGEWDGLMQETFQLKQNLESVRQELSHALYQHDAACRVIARLSKERDEARNRLAELREGTRPQTTRMEEEPRELPQEVVQSIVARQKELNATRKEKKKNTEIAGRYATAQALSGYKLSNSVTLHSSSNPGITALDIHPENDDLLVTGGNDGSVVLYNKGKNQVVGTFDKDNRKITEAVFVPLGDAGKAHALTSSEDGIGRLISYNTESGESSETYSVSIHQDALVGCALHPLNTLGLFASRDGSFSYHDLAQGKCLSYVGLDGYSLRTLKVHPDGHIAALAGSDGTVRIWNILEQTQVAELKAHDGPITSLAFSENGINFATSSLDDKSVKLWDLRNLAEGNFKNVDSYSGGVVAFDRFGQYLAVGSTSLRLFNVKDLEEFARWDDHKDVITGIQFGQYSKYIATTSLDRQLNIYS